VDLHRVDEAINEERILDFFKGIVRIPSPRFEEENVARYIGAYLDGMGMKVEFQKYKHNSLETVNVIGRYGRNQGGKRIILNAHMDTGSGQYQGLVFQPERWTKDPLGPVVEDGYFYGLGSHNDKQGVACMVMAADAVIKSGIPIDGELIVAAASAETVGGVGSGYLVKGGLTGDLAVVLEGTGMDIVNVAVGKVRGRILVKGEHEHHSVHTNPVETLRYLLEAFHPGYGNNRAMSFLTTKQNDPRLPNVPGTALRWVHNDAVDLDKVAAFFDVLALPDQSPDSVKADFERLIAALKKEHPEFDAEVEVQGWEPPMSGNFCWGAPPTSEDSEIVRTVAKYHEKIRKEKPVIGSGRRFGATSDAASFRRVGIPTVEYAPGSIGPGGELKAWPAVDERVRVKDVFDCTRILAQATAELVNQPRTK